MALVIASGLAIGTLVTLSVLPAVYLAIAARHRRGKEAVGATDLRVNGARSGAL
jgi:multidrug efflux pump